MRKEPGRGRIGKPTDDFEDDETGDRGDEAATSAAAAATAGVSPAHNVEGVARKFIEAWEDQQAEVDAINDQAKEDGRPYRDEIKQIKKAAAEEGVPKKVLSALFTRRRKLRQANAIITKLSEEQADNYTDLMLALGDDFMTNTPLGLHAAEKAAKATRARR